MKKENYIKLNDFFLAVQDSSIGDIDSQSLIKSVRLLISASSEHYRAVVDNDDDIKLDSNRRTENLDNSSLRALWAFGHLPTQA